MLKLRSWFSAARLRTLPLSISGIIVGTAMASKQGYFNLSIFLLALATTLALQILSNFANDYGDGVKGTDNEDRVGPMRATQSGIISHREMLYAVIFTSIITLILAVFLIYAAFGKENLFLSFFFLILGIAAIAAAIKYTVGNSAYGYRGLGDAFVFVFFGLVAVCGSYFLYTNFLGVSVFFPAAGIGLLSTAVLNLNNMRDQLSDAKSGKNTLVVKMGARAAKQFHYTIIITAFLCFSVYVLIDYQDALDLLYLVAFIAFGLHIKRVWKNNNPMLLDPELKIVALSTFATALLFAIGQIW